MNSAGHVTQNSSPIPVVNAANAAAFVFVLWDFLLTFSEEVEYIWPKHWLSPTKWAFLISRYWALLITFAFHESGRQDGVLVSFLHGSNCHRWYTFQLVSLQALIMCSQFILSIRVHAMYGSPPRLAHVLSALFIAEHVLVGVTDILSIRQIQYDDFCLSTFVPTSTLGIGIAPLAYDLLLLVLTLVRCGKEAMSHRQRAASRLWYTLARDGALAFFAVFLVFGLNGLFFLAGDGRVGSVAWSWQFAVTAVAPCRLLLHMHRRARPRGSDTRHLRSPRNGDRRRSGGSLCGLGRSGGESITDGRDQVQGQRFRSHEDHFALSTIVHPEMSYDAP